MMLSGDLITWSDWNERRFYESAHCSSYSPLVCPFRVIAGNIDSVHFKYI
jgi:hypothetical protein